MKSCYGHAERFRLQICWCDYGAAGQAVGLTVMELLGSKWSVRRPGQSLKATLFGVSPVWSGEGDGWSDHRQVDSRVGRLQVGRRRKNMKMAANQTELVFQLSESPDSAPGWDWAESLCQLLFPDFYYVWNIRKNKDWTRSKDQRINLVFYSEKKIVFLSARVWRQKKIKNSRFQGVVIKVNSRSRKPHLFTFWYLQRFNTWAGLLHVWYIPSAKAACCLDFFFVFLSASLQDGQSRRSF